MNFERVHEVLDKMPACQACLIVLKDVCDASEKEILRLLAKLQSVPEKGLEARHELAAFVQLRAPGFSVRWSPDLLVIGTRECLAVRLHRARQQFQELWSK